MMVAMPQEEALTATEALERAQRDEAEARTRLRQSQERAAQIRSASPKELLDAVLGRRR